MKSAVSFSRMLSIVVLLAAASACGGGGASGGGGGGGIVPPAPTPVPTATAAGTVVTRLAMNIPNPPAPNGVPTTVPVRAIAYDSLGAQIAGKYYAPITFTIAANTGVTLLTGSVQSSTDAVLLGYDGHSLVNPTIGASVANVYGDFPNATVFRPSLGGTEYSLGSDVAGTQLVNVADGSMWFNGFNDVGRLTTSGTSTVFPVGTNGGNVVAAGPDGNAWMVSSGASDTQFLARLTPSAVGQTYPTPTTTFNGNLNLNTGPDGKLWYSGLTPGGLGTSVWSMTTGGVASTAFAFNYPGIGYAPVPNVVAIFPQSTGIVLFDGTGNVYNCTYAGVCTAHELPPTFPGTTVPIYPAAVTQGPSGDLYAVSAAALTVMNSDGSARWTAYLTGNFISSPAVSYGSFLWTGRGLDDDNRAIVTRYESNGSYVDFVGPSEATRRQINAMNVGSDGRLWYTRSAFAGVIQPVTGALVP